MNNKSKWLAILHPKSITKLYTLLLTETFWHGQKKNGLSKLLGHAFDLHLDLHNVDNFMVDKIQGELTYCSTSYLSLGGRILMVNQMLVSFTMGCRCSLGRFKEGLELG